MPQQGKCTACEIRFMWKTRHPLHHCFCPECERPLRMSRKDVNYPTVHKDPIVIKPKDELKIDTQNIEYWSAHKHFMQVYGGMSVHLLIDFRETAEYMEEQSHGKEHEIKARIDVLKKLIKEKQNEEKPRGVTPHKEIAGVG